MFGSAPADRYLPYAISDRRRGSHIRYWKRLSACYHCLTALCVRGCAGAAGCAGAGGAVDITEEGLRYLRQWVNESGIRGG